MERLAQEELDLEAILPAYNYDSNYLKNYKVSLNSRNPGRGRGLAAFYKEDKFSVTQNFTDVDLQISVFEAEDLTVIGIYRSQQDTNITMLLAHLIPDIGNVLVLGDMNICSRFAV